MRTLRRATRTPPPAKNSGAAFEALVPDTLKALRFKYGLSLKPAVWPVGAPIQVLTQLHRLLDGDDAVQALYAAAIQADIDENTVSGAYAAMRAHEALNGPDPFAREWVRDFPLSDDDAAACVWG